MIGSAPLTLRSLLLAFPRQVIGTWSLLVVEVALLALVPLLIGRAIDGLLAERGLAALVPLAVLLGALIVVAVVRRAYDTRVYGTMRVHLTSALVDRSEHKSLSQLTAQVGMGRELVDFLEEQTPVLIASIVQIVVAVAVLFGFGLALGSAGIVAVVTMLGLYLIFHRRFFELNAELNGLSEEQVQVLASSNNDSIVSLFSRRRASEVKISDTDSVMYGLVYVVMFALILTNLWSSSVLPAVTVGAIFAIISYSWELVGASAELPATLQQWTRLAEIEARINK